MSTRLNDQEMSVLFLNRFRSRDGPNHSSLILSFRQARRKKTRQQQAHKLQQQHQEETTYQRLYATRQHTSRTPTRTRSFVRHQPIQPLPPSPNYRPTLPVSPLITGRNTALLDTARPAAPVPSPVPFDGVHVLRDTIATDHGVAVTVANDGQILSDSPSFIPVPLAVTYSVGAGGAAAAAVLPVAMTIHALGGAQDVVQEHNVVVAKEHVRDDVTCAICLELKFKAVKLPTCSHVFCKSCVIELQRKNNGFPCPLCREKTPRGFNTTLEDVPTRRWIELHFQDELVEYETARMLDKHC